MLYKKREDWGASSPVKTLPVSKRLKGVCIHWMGFHIPDGDTTRVVKSIQTNHMARGWFDIAYNELIDQQGVVYEGRSFQNRSGAQGGNKNNKGYVAIGLLIGPGQTPTAQMIEATKARIASVQNNYTKQLKIVGHQELKPTACPGPEVMALIRAGVFEGKQKPTLPTPQWPEPTTTVRYKSRGVDVKWVQFMLNLHGATLVVDGIAGPATTRAVRDFQKKRKLKIDGIVGPQTRGALKK